MTPARSHPWVVAVGLLAVAGSVTTVVLVPLVAALVAGWWLMVDARSAGESVPGWLGKAGLALLAVVWIATAWLIVGFDAHFDCGGTLGGFGESSSARLDEECYGRRALKIPLAVSVVVAGALVGGFALRRRARSSTGDDVASLPWRRSVVSVVAGNVAVWVATIVVLVVI